MDYAKLLKDKLELYQSLNIFLRINFSVIQISCEGRGSILKFPVIKSLLQYWTSLIKIHHSLTSEAFLKPIIAFIAQNLLEEEYNLICLVTHCLFAIKMMAEENR